MGKRIIRKVPKGKFFIINGNNIKFFDNKKLAQGFRREQLRRRKRK